MTTAVSSASGLDLSATINATNIAVGQSVNITLLIFNTLPNVNSVPASSDFAFQGVPVAVWPPCYFDVPMEVVVLQGNYTGRKASIGCQCDHPIHLHGRLGH